MFTVPGLTLYCMADTAYIAFAHEVLDESGTRHVGLDLTQEEFVKLMRAPSLATFQQIDRELFSLPGAFSYLTYFFIFLKKIKIFVEQMPT